jgi:hypothetical protein
MVFYRKSGRVRARVQRKKVKGSRSKDKGKRYKMKTVLGSRYKAKDTMLKKKRRTED